MTRLLMSALAATFLGWGPAHAQLSGSVPSPLGMTSPLGIGPAAAVPRSGIPLGTTELGSAGVSPTISGTSPLGPVTSGSMATCAGINSMAGNLSVNSSSSATSSAGMSGSSPLFDGGGVAGTASGTCAGIGAQATTSSSPTGMSSPSGIGRIGIPMGSTELGVGGLSPMPQIPTPNPSAPTSTTTIPCATTGMSSSGMSSGSC